MSEENISVKTFKFSPVTVYSKQLKSGLSIKNHPFQFSLLLHLKVFQSVGERFI